MILLLTTTYRPATDLGYLLHKNPANLHEAEMSFGTARVVYTEASEERCAVALILDVDPVALVRGRSSRMDQYVNDRPYVASSFMSTAIANFFSTAMTGRSKERQELADTPIPIEARIPVLPCRGGERILRELFEPLGYEIDATRLPLDEKFPDWGDSPYFDLTLRANTRVRDILRHLYVLIPVLDHEKHYWVEKSEIDKLLLRGKDWLAAHPAKEEIVRRYLKWQTHLTREALARLVEEDPDPDQTELEHSEEEEQVERGMSLNEIRMNMVFAALKESGAKRVLDLGCGEGRLIERLLKDRQFEKIVGVDVSVSALEKTARRLRLERMGPKARERLTLLHSSLVYRDSRLAGFDAAAVVEVIEHLDAHRLDSFERILFQETAPATVILTTPNREYNDLFEFLPAGAMRHRDHRFEWTRAEFNDWATRVAESHGYRLRILPIGPEDSDRGAPTQMAVFER